MSAMLREHGTRDPGDGLKPKNILDAAAADLVLAEKKKAGEAPVEQRYSFMQRHVRRAKSVPHLIALALFEKLPSSKESTNTIYGNDGLLIDILIDELTAMRITNKAQKGKP